MRITLIIFSFIFSCCGVKEEIYPVKGTIRNISSHDYEVTIAHDTIPNLMMPMIMPFQVPDKNELNKLQVGDSVHFEFVWGDTMPYARKFRYISQGHVPVYDDFFKDSFSPLNIGDTLDDVTLISIDSNEVKLSESDGHYRFISYIFTRCPMPTMCPAVVLKNKYLVNSFKEDKRINFVLISFDYLYDTPSKLKDYYGSSVKEYKTLEVWSSYKKVNDIYLLGKQAGCEFWGIEKEKIGHTMQSILINNKRIILGKWKGENWDQKMVKNNIKALIN